MIYHRQDGGVIRTDPTDPTQLRCALFPEIHVWKAKDAEFWKDCVIGEDVTNDVKMHPDLTALLVERIADARE